MPSSDTDNDAPLRRPRNRQVPDHGQAAVRVDRLEVAVDAPVKRGARRVATVLTSASVPAGSVTGRRALRAASAAGSSSQIFDQIDPMNLSRTALSRRDRRAQREQTAESNSDGSASAARVELHPHSLAANPTDLVLDAVEEESHDSLTIIQDDPDDVAEHNAIVDERDATTLMVDDVVVKPVAATVSPTIVLESEAVPPLLDLTAEFETGGTATSVPAGEYLPAPSPRSAFSPSTENRTAAPVAAHGHGRGRRVVAKSFSFAAFTIVGLLTLATSLPANALLSADDVAAQKVLVTQGDPAPALQTQTVSASGDWQSEAVERDLYGAVSAIEAAEAIGIQPEATFTNNPNGTIQWPYAVGVHIGSDFGPRPGCPIGCSTDHKGQDFNPGLGAPIQSIADGVVVQSTESGGAFGVKIVIEHVIDGQVIRTLYAHMLEGSRTVEVGDPVTVGQIIAKTGNSGRSTGPHLHFEVLLNGTENVDPLAWLYANTN